MDFKKTRSKYGNVKEKFNGIEFDSKAEAKRYKELLWLQRANQITDLELQPKFILQPSFKNNGKTIRAITYIADFKYIDKSGKVIVEDVKGFVTDVFKIKEKMFLFIYGNECDFRRIK